MENTTEPVDKTANKIKQDLRQIFNRYDGSHHIKMLDAIQDYFTSKLGAIVEQKPDGYMHLEDKSFCSVEKYNDYPDDWKVVYKPFYFSPVKQFYDISNPPTEDGEYLVVFKTPLYPKFEVCKWRNADEAEEGKFYYNIPYCGQQSVMKEPILWMPLPELPQI